MKRPNRLSVWLFLFCLLLGIGASLSFYLARKTAEIQSQNHSLKHKLIEKRTTLIALEKDVRQTEDLAQTLPEEEVENLLAQPSWEELRTKLEASAAAYGITNLALDPGKPHPFHLAYGFKDDPVQQTTLTLEADAPDDLTLRSFWQNLSTLLPGQMVVQSLTLERLTPFKGKIGTSNLHVKAKCSWQHNPFKEAQP